MQYRKQDQESEYDQHLSVGALLNITCNTLFSSVLAMRLEGFRKLPTLPALHAEP